MAILNTDIPECMADAVAQAVAALVAGQLVGLPTETVYGLAADASSADAVRQVFALKGRPADHPLIVHVPMPFLAEGGLTNQRRSREGGNPERAVSRDPRFRGDDVGGRGQKCHSREGGNPEDDLSQRLDQAWLEVLAPWVLDVPDLALPLINAFWPGPLTLVLPKHPDVLDMVTGGQSTVALRCPDHPVAQAVLQGFAKRRPGAGLAAPSANRFGHISPTTAQHVTDEFGDALAVILDGGPCTAGIESTIVDLSRGAAVLLRPGALSAECIEAVLAEHGQQELLRQTRESIEQQSVPTSPSKAGLSDSRSTPRVSGHLAQHYSPSKPLWSVSADQLTSLMRHVAEGGGVQCQLKSVAEHDGHAEGVANPRTANPVDKLSMDPTRTAVITWSLPTSPDLIPREALIKSPDASRAMGFVQRFPTIWPVQHMLRLPSDPEGLAARLYDVLRAAEALPVDHLLIEAITDPSPAWEALRDRLGRAVRGHVC